VDGGPSDRSDSGRSGARFWGAWSAWSAWNGQVVSKNLDLGDLSINGFNPIKNGFFNHEWGTWILLGYAAQLVAM